MKRNVLILEKILPIQLHIHTYSRVWNKWSKSLHIQREPFGDSAMVSLTNRDDIAKAFRWKKCHRLAHFKTLQDQDFVFFFFFCSVKVVQILFYTFTLTTIFSLCNGRISGLWATSLKSKNYKWDRTLYYDMITALHTACCILKKWQKPHDFIELKQHNLFTSCTFQPNLLSY